MNRNDLHFHILPGIDDGPATLEESLALAADAAADGTAVAVATPHIRPAHVTDVSELPCRVDELRAELRRAGIPLELRVGGELGHGMVERLRDCDLATIAQGPPGGRWILLEAPFLGLDEHFHDASQELRERGFGVLIAHPERAAGTSHDLAHVRREIVAGSLLQVNVWSLAGRHGNAPRATGLRLISEGLVAVVASDAHADWRRPLLSRAMLDLEHAGIDERTIRSVAATGPRRLLEAGVRARPLLRAA